MNSCLEMVTYLYFILKTIAGLTVIFWTRIVDLYVKCSHLPIQSIKLTVLNSLELNKPKDRQGNICFTNTTLQIHCLKMYVFFILFKKKNLAFCGC